MEEEIDITDDDDVGQAIMHNSKKKQNSNHHDDLSIKSALFVATPRTSPLSSINAFNLENDNNCDTRHVLDNFLCHLF